MRVTNSIIGMTVLVVVACSLSASPASASAIVVPFLTGNAVAVSEGTPLGSLFNNFTLGSRVGFAGVPAIHSTPASAPCAPSGTGLVTCGWSWSGSLKGATISFLVLPPNSAPFDNGFSFAGVITGGTYSGEGTAACLAVCELNLHETAQFTFTGKWAEGYSPQPPFNLFSAKGRFTGTSFYQSGGLPGVPGDAWFGSSFSGPMETFTPNPAIPEPSSLLMLGSGLLGVAGVIRRKLN
jgi:hypothetical protein